MKCPSCGSDVEEGADLCLECGEPMGDSPVARVVRSEDATTKPIPKLDPFSLAVVHTRAPKIDPPRRARVVDDEPEPARCPGCGLLSRRERCPGCGTVLRRSGD